MYYAICTIHHTLCTHTLHIHFALCNIHTPLSYMPPHMHYAHRIHLVLCCCAVLWYCAPSSIEPPARCPLLSPTITSCSPATVPPPPMYLTPLHTENVFNPLLQFTPQHSLTCYRV
ncbi:hypothetical protein B484DRAFT_278756 [Ochromonadaceae sp. CCMP2298]|nr:hypothetical protein B484DRAFT_278756 [Ochromonadaceae sp. CCMP2298]